MGDQLGDKLTGSEEMTNRNYLNHLANFPLRNWDENKVVRVSTGL